MLSKGIFVIKGNYFIWNKIWKNTHQSSVRNTDLFMNIFVKKYKVPIISIKCFGYCICSPRLNIHIAEDVQP